VAEDVTGCLLDQGFQPLAITVSDGERAGRLPGPARDPFDRMLIAQALTLDVAMVSIEEPFDRYGVRRLW
jgi:PIN domain nuclease of toxin-antitoxin system